MIGRIVRPADFERVLATAPRSRSAHFAVHHLSGWPSLARKAEPNPVVPRLSPELSTGAALVAATAVDDLPAVAPPALTQPGPRGHWLGLVVPKRHAKRAVTRNLIKRQIRAAMAHHAAALPAGLWVVRLRQGFDRAQFHSPASDALQASARAEIAQLFGRLLQAPAPSVGHSR
ncbi:MAG: ribonuclease P protein component [Burkholderiaceae bacterium]